MDTKDIHEIAEEEFNKWIFPEECQECGSSLIEKKIDSGREYTYTCEDCDNVTELDSFEFDIDELKIKFFEIFRLGFEKAEELKSEVGNE